MKKPKPKPPELPLPETATQRAFRLYASLAPLMAEHGSPIQGNAISMLLGTWLSGHKVFGKDGKVDWEKTREIRSNMMVLTTKAGFAYAADRDQQQSSKEAEDEPKGRDRRN